MNDSLNDSRHERILRSKRGSHEGVQEVWPHLERLHLLVRVIVLTDTLRVFFTSSDVQGGSVS